MHPYWSAQISQIYILQKTHGEDANMQISQTGLLTLPTCMKMKVLKTTELDLVRS